MASPTKGGSRTVATMTTDAELQTWIAERAAADDQLYERYGRQLEAEHFGEFVAISDDGRLILGQDELTVATKAIQQFGAGEFAVRRIGADAEIRWRSLA
jgi:hypothetical protein